MSGLWAFKQLCEIIGFPTSAKKDQPPSTQMVLLGADVSLHDTHTREGPGKARSRITTEIANPSSHPVELTNTCGGQQTAGGARVLLIIAFRETRHGA